VCVCVCVCVCVRVCVVLGFELQASQLQGRHSTLEPLHQPCFVLDYFQDTVLRAISQSTGFEP
jgi:hypothetical protein